MMQNNKKNRKIGNIKKILFGFFVIEMLLLPSASVCFRSNCTLENISFNQVQASSQAERDALLAKTRKDVEDTMQSTDIAGAAATWIGDNIISKLLEVLFGLSGFLVSLAIIAVNIVTSPVLFDEVFFSDPAKAGINAGWGLVRDFINMFFILILVFLAIATILRVNKFADKKMLVSVLFAALLVNFSKPITMFFIDMSNLAMSFFMQNISGNNRSLGSALINNMGYGDFVNATPEEEKTGKTTGWYVAMIMLIIFNTVLATMMIFLAISLIIRLVAFWVLIVLSPLAFFGIALPGTYLTTIRNTWTKKFVAWLFFGPVMLFFFWLALVMVSALTTSIKDSDEKAKMDFNALGAVSDLGGVFIPFVACIYMLFYGYSLSKSIADGAGSSVAGVLGKGGDWAKKGMKYSTGAAAAVATGGLAVGGYLGYKAGQNKAQNIKEGISGNEKIPFTKAWQDKKGKKTKRNWEEAGNKDQKRKNFATDVNDNLKQADERGMNNDELKNWQEKGTQTQRAAASLRLAKDGKLSHADGSYGRAVESMAGNPGMVRRLEDNAKKNNRHAMVEHAIEQRTGESRAEDLTKSEGKIRQEEYDKSLKNLSLPQIADQSDELHNSEEFHDFMKRKVANNGFSDKQLRGTDKLSPEKREIWERENFFARPERENLSEEETNDAMGDMNR